MSMHESMNDDASPPSDAALDRAGARLRGALPAPAFAAGFSDRTMAALAASRAAAAATAPAPAPAPAPAVLRASAMQHHFRIVAAAAAVLIAALGIHNTVVVRNADASIVEAAIGLQPVSVESVLSSTVDTYQ